MQFNPISILDVIHETKDAITICFDPKETPIDFLQFTPGQHITLKVLINGIECRRSYSICSALHENILKVTVKKLSGGLVSNHLVNTLQAGDRLEISKPEGHFCILPSPDKRLNYFFFAAGSGITPIFSMIKSLLENEPKSNLYLLYGNRNEDDIIFNKELESLMQKYEEQLHVNHTLSKIKNKGLPFLSNFKETWSGWKGRINESMIKRFIDNYPVRNSGSSYYICGPGDLIESTKSSLLKLDIDIKSIHTEYFTTPVNALSTKQTVPSPSEVTLIAHLNGKRYELKMPGNKKILDVLMDAKLDPPYSCSSGACSTCMAKIIQGEVKMDIALALEPEEIADGYILTCQSRPLSPVVEIQF